MELEPKPINPGATLDFSCDWSDWLKSGETVASFVITPGPDLIVNSGSASSTTITAWVTLPATVPIGQVLKLVFKVVTNNVPPRTDYRTMHLIATEREV